MCKTTEQIREEIEGKVNFTVKADGGSISLWENVIVTAHYKDHQGYAYLNAADYDSREEFMQGGYYEEMKAEALECLVTEIEFAIKQVAEFV